MNSNSLTQDGNERKTFVLDTNILLHNPNVLLDFANNHVVIPMTVLEELDNFKTKSTELGRNSREVVRLLDKLRKKGSLRAGVATEKGGIIQVILRYATLDGLLPGIMDNKILGCAHLLKEEGHNVSFISKDINARIKADSLGIDTDDYDVQKVNIDELPTGIHRATISSGIFHDFKEGIPIPADDPCLEDLDIAANEYLIIREEDATQEDKHLVGRFDIETQTLTPIDSHIAHVSGIHPRNIEQVIALDLLLNDNVKLITLVGTAGTGKTLLALAAGMQKTLREEAYNKMLVSRPIMPLGQDIGYLPGTKDEKMTHWMGPIFDNLHFILAHEERDPDDIIRSLIDNETISLEALTYIRGRSISHQYLIVDEAQNLTPHEIKTIVSRAGERTKIVLTGDPYQIDNPYLDASSNGLTYVTERMRGHSIAGHITLKRAERSELAGVAAEVL